MSIPSRADPQYSNCVADFSIAGEYGVNLGMVATRSDILQYLDGKNDLFYPGSGTKVTQRIQACLRFAIPSDKR